jgi:hypothetical protein
MKPENELPMLHLLWRDFAFCSRLAFELCERDASHTPRLQSASRLAGGRKFDSAIENRTLSDRYRPGESTQRVWKVVGRYMYLARFGSKLPIGWVSGWVEIRVGRAKCTPKIGGPLGPGALYTQYGALHGSSTLLDTLTMRMVDGTRSPDGYVDVCGTPCRHACVGPYHSSTGELAVNQCV